jgi:hypothetical protein
MLTMMRMLNYVGFEVFTAVVLKSIFFWDMTRLYGLHGVISQKKILFMLNYPLLFSYPHNNHYKEEILPYVH